MRVAAVCGLLVLAIAAVIAVLATGTSSGLPPRKVESIFQDDRLLLYSPAQTVARAIATLRAAGADRLRLTVQWLNIAPSPTSRIRPAGFDATNPADYPQRNWTRYDVVVQLAHAAGMGVDFNVTAPGPRWAMGAGPRSAKAANHYKPSASEFGEFVQALGRRYSGNYVPPGATSSLPRVAYWTIWNEPNQPGWLLPQWSAASGQWQMTSPAIYRALVNSGYLALKRTGHSSSTDTVLIGELAPEGSEEPGAQQAIPPMKFLRAMYCVTPGFQPLHGGQATSLGCPANPSAGAFVTDNPGLFDATGFAHHPYSFFVAPSVQLSDRNFVPLADLDRLDNALSQIMMTYDPNISLPVYLTEYGYETNPPNPYRGVSLRLQSAYLNEAEYIAWEDPRVKSLAQFLLVDSAPDTRFRPGSFRYWSTFQTGLLFLNGKPKPSFNSYRLPIFLPNPTVRAGHKLFVWGMLRLAPNGTRQHAEIQWRPLRGQYRAISTVSTDNPDGFLTTYVALPGSGAVRIAWVSSTGATYHSRAVGVRVIG